MREVWESWEDWERTEVWDKREEWELSRDTLESGEETGSSRGLISMRLLLSSSGVSEKGRLRGEMRAIPSEDRRSFLFPFRLILITSLAHKTGDVMFNA